MLVLYPDESITVQNPDHVQSSKLQHGPWRSQLKNRIVQPNLSKLMDYLNLSLSYLCFVKGHQNKFFFKLGQCKWGL